MGNERANGRYMPSILTAAFALLWEYIHFCAARDELGSLYWDMEEEELYEN